MIKRMKEAGCTIEDMREVYIKQMRSLTEIGCPSWNGALTKMDIAKIENIHKTALHIIPGQKYLSYENALKTLNLKRLEERRYHICEKFARKSEKSDKFSKWFIPAVRQTKSDNRYILPNARTRAYQKSPLMYLTNLLNGNYDEL